MSFKICQRKVSSRVARATKVALTLCLKATISSSVKVSALAITGIRLTLRCSLRMNSISIGRSLHSGAFSKSAGANQVQRHLRVTRRLNEVDTGVYPVIHQLCPIHPIFLFKVGIETGFDVVDDRLPSTRMRGAIRVNVSAWRTHASSSYASSLLTKSPKPGVSTTVNLSRTSTLR